MQNGSLFGFQLTLYFLWLVIIAPLWAMGQYWTSLFYLGNSTVEMTNIEHLLGYYFFLFALFILLVLLIIYIPRFIFSFYFLTNGAKNPLQASTDLTKGKYWHVLLHIGIASTISFFLVQGINQIFSYIPLLFSKLYTPTYIAWAERFSFISMIIGNGLATGFSMTYFYKLWHKYQKS